MIFKHIFGLVEVKIFGDNITKLLNELYKSKIITSKLTSKENTITATVYGKDIKNLKEICDRNFCELEIIKKSGTVYEIKKHQKRYGVLIGIGLSLIVMLFLSNTVLQIEIKGCEDKQIEQHVMNYISKNGINYGKFIPKIDIRDITNGLILSSENIAWASIKSIGSKIIIDVNEATLRPEQVPSNSPSNIIASRDGRIIRVEVLSGQLMVLVGEGVKEGDLLISGLVEYQDGSHKKFHSIGKVIAEYEETVTFSKKFCDIEETYIKNAKKERYFNFFGLKIPMFIGKKVSGNYVPHSETTYISFLGLKLPLGITEVNYDKILRNEINKSIEEIEDDIANLISKHESNFYNEDRKIISKEIKKIITESEVRYEVKYVIQGDISKEEKLLLK